MSATENRYINVFINGKQVGFNVKDLTAEYRALKNQIAGVTIGSDEYNRKAAEMQKIGKILNEHREAVSGINRAWDSTKTVLMGVVGGNLISGFFSRVTSSIRQQIGGVVDLDEAYADAMKTTDLTRQEIRGLSQDLKKVDSRTSEQELLKIVEVGGRMGEAKEELLGFTVAIDKANVALGDEFTGGAEEVATVMAKIKGLFKETADLKSGDAITYIGSAINDLGAKYNSTGPNIAEFTQRMGALPKALKPALQDVMALASITEEAGISAEVGSRGYSIFVQTAAGKMKEFAQVMDMSEEKAKALFNKDNIAFAKEFAKRINGLSATETQKVFDGLGIGAEGTIKVIGALSTNMKRFEETQETAYQSFAKGTSLQEEFNIKNTTTGAEIEKLSKSWSSLWTSETVQDGMKSFVGGLTSIVDWLKRNATAIGTVLSWLGKAAIAWGAYKLLQMVNVKAAWQWIASQYASIAANQKQIQVLYGVGRAKAMLYAGVMKVGDAFNKLKSIVMANPLGAIAIAAYALYEVFRSLTSQTSALSKAQEKMAEIEKEHLDNFEKERAEVDLLFGQLRGMNEANEERGKLIDKINSKYGTSLKNLKDEKDFISLVNAEYNRLIKSMTAKVDLEIAQEQFAELRRSRAQLMREEKELMKEWGDGTGLYGDVAKVMSEDMKAQAKELDKESDALAKKIVQMQSKLNDAVKTGDVIASPEVESTKVNTSGLGEGKEKKKDYQVEEVKKLTQTLKQLQNDLTNSVLTDQQREIIAIAEKYEKEYEKADEIKEKLQELAKNGDQKAIEQIKQIDAVKVQLAANAEKEITAKKKEQLKEQSEAQAAFWHDYMQQAGETQSKISDSLLDDRAREIAATQKSYQDLIDAAKKYGLDTTELEEKRLQAIKALQDAYEEEDQKKRTEKIQATVQKFKEYYDQLAIVLDAIGEYQDAKDEERLNQISDGRDRELSGLEAQKREGLITEEEYAAAKDGIEEKYRKKEREIKKQGFIRDKRAKILQSIINTALGVTAAIPNPFLMAAAGAAGAIATGLIIAQPVPEFARGGVVKGATHRQGGISMIDSLSGQKVGEMEHNEPYMILSGKTYENNKPVVNALLRSSMYGGGKKISMAGLMGRTMSPNLANAPRNVRYDKGGIYPNNSTYTAGAETGDRMADLNAIVLELRTGFEQMRNDMNRWNREIYAPIYWRNVKKFEGDLERTQERANMG